MKGSGDDILRCLTFGAQFKRKKSFNSVDVNSGKKDLRDTEFKVELSQLYPKVLHNTFKTC